MACTVRGLHYCRFYNHFCLPHSLATYIASCVASNPLLVVTLPMRLEWARDYPRDYMLHQWVLHESHISLLF